MLFGCRGEQNTAAESKILPRKAKWQKQGSPWGPWQSEYLSRESQFLLRREAFVKEFEIVGVFLGYEIRPRGVVNALDSIQKASRQRFSTVL